MSHADTMEKARAEYRKFHPVEEVHLESIKATMKEANAHAKAEKEI